MNKASHLQPSYLEPAQAGRSLREVGVDFLNVENQRIKSRWFHSGQDVDLFVWTDSKDQVIKQQMSFCGQIVEWNILDGLKTGVIVEQEGPLREDADEPDSSEQIQFDREPQAQAIRMALLVIQNMTPLAPEEKQSLLLNFGAYDLPRVLGGLGKGSVWARFKHKVKHFLKRF